jgi:hypothetical protein
MKRNKTAIGFFAAALVSILGVAAIPSTGIAGEDDQAEREARRIEGEARRQQEMARRQIEERERTQAEALRGQEEAIRRMEATRSRIEANTQQLVQQSVEQARAYGYPYSSSYPPVGPAQGPAQSEPARPGDAVSGMNLAPLSERLGNYFGAQSGVLVVRAGANAPFGLQDGDVILSIDGRVPADDRHAAGILRSYRPGEPVKLQIQRDRRAITVETTAPGQRGN